MRTSHLSTPVVAFAFVLAGSAAATSPPEPPSRLSETGLYLETPSRTLAPGVIAFRPRYPLWTDGLEKERWILLPPGTSIDASDPGVWTFPLGTRLWKEFALGERPIETRYLELAESGWTFATYAWSTDGSDAILAPPRGIRGAAEIAPGVRHDIPGRLDCTSCHHGQAQPVLGFGAVQLAAGRTEIGAPDLLELSARGLVTGLPSRLLRIPQSPARGPEPLEAAALGYLHGNCGHCHNSEGPLAPLGLDLRLEPGEPPTGRAIATTLGRRTSTAPRSAPAEHRVLGGDPRGSQLLQRVSSLDPFARMPPLGTRLVDATGVALLTAWVTDVLGRDVTGAASTPRPDSGPSR